MINQQQALNDENVPNNLPATPGIVGRQVKRLRAAEVLAQVDGDG
jgi:hypothetical protein